MAAGAVRAPDRSHAGSPACSPNAAAIDPAARKREATGDLRHGDAAQHLVVPVTGVQVLALAVDDAGDGSAGDWGDWLSPYLSC